MKNIITDSDQIRSDQSLSHVRLFATPLPIWLLFFQWSCMDVRVGLWRKLRAEELMLLNCSVGEDSCESLRLQGDPTSPYWSRSILGVHGKNWCWGWNSNTLATWCKELTHWKRPWCWEGLGAGGEGDDRGWDGWMASPTQCTWVWVNSRSWSWTEMPGVLQFMGSQRVRQNWATELNWTDMLYYEIFVILWINLCLEKFLIFNGISIPFSIVAVQIYIPTNSARGFPFLHIFSSIYYL